MKLTLYKNESDNRVVSKVIKDDMVVMGELKDSCSVTNPTFILAKSTRNFFSGYNYLYCEELNRYYYIDDMVFSLGHQVVITCTVDVLMTYADEIRNLTTVVDRQESINNPYIEDAGMTIAQGSVIKAIDVGAVGDDSYTCYITSIGAVEEEVE